MILRVLKQVTPTVASGGDYEVATTAVPAGYWIALEMVLSLPADFNGKNLEVTWDNGHRYTERNKQSN